MKIENKLACDADMDPKIKAFRLYKKSTTGDTIEVHNGMWPFLTEVSLNEAGEIVLQRTPANHNLLSPQLAREITNNIYKNVMDADLTDKQHDETMGKDMHCLLTYNAKVRPNIRRHASLPYVAHV